MVKNLQYYQRNDKEMSEEIGLIKSLISGIGHLEEINNILNFEGRIWETYFKGFNKIIPENFRFETRTRRPPENMANCLISFGNMLLYSTVLTEIYNTQINPTISFLHEPSERRFSLSLDISEVFKPFLVDRTIFKLLNKNMLTENHFVKELNSCLLNEAGRRIFIQEWDERLKTTIKHRSLNRNVSYQRLIRLECYKLIKHFIGVKDYSAFRMWW